MEAKRHCFSDPDYLGRIEMAVTQAVCEQRILDLKERGLKTREAIDKLTEEVESGLLFDRAICGDIAKTFISLSETTYNDRTYRN